MTPASLRRAVATTVLALAAAAPVAGAAQYCVERSPDYVLNRPVHDGIRRCVPGPG